MNILYLYAEIRGYQIPILKEYVEKYKARVHVVHWDYKKLTPYIVPMLDNVIYHNRSACNKSQLKELAKNLEPDIVYVSGWQDRDYLHVAYYLRKRRIPVITGFDDQWRGSLKQRIGAILFPFILKRF